MPEIKNITIHSTTQVDYTAQVQIHEDKEYLVVPVVMLVEGVHNGSAGPILHLQEHYAQNPEAWNGVPLTAMHPQDEEGRHVSVTQVNQDHWVVGFVNNARVEGGKLKAEAWIDRQRAIAVNPEVVNYLMEGKKLEVSTGMGTVDTHKTGQWNGEDYQAVTMEYYPDHLALLPGEVGACSWVDGCGIRTNQQEDPNDMSKDNEMTITDNQVTGSLPEQSEGQAEPEVVQDNKETSNAACGCTIKRTKFNNNTNTEDIMSNEEKSKQPSGEVMDKVVSLINNERTQFSKTDRPWLLQLNEDQLDKLEPMEVPEPEITREQAVQALSEDLADTEKLMGIVADDIKERVETGIKAYKDQREKFIKQIQANTGDIWKKEKLESMDTETLQALEKSSRKTDYSGQGPVEVTTNAEEDGVEMLLPAGVKLEN